MAHNILFHEKRRKLKYFASAIAVATGALVLTGWTVDIPFLKEGIPGFPTMKPTTALLFVLLGIALSCTSKASATISRIGANFSALLVLIVASVELAEFVVRFDTGFDAFIVNLLTFGAAAEPTGSMSPQSAANFILLSLGLLLLNKGKRAALASETLVLIALIFTFAALLGHLYGASELNRSIDFNLIAVHAAVAFAVLGIGALGVNRGSRLVNLFLSETLGGMAARRLLALALIVPATVGLITTGQILGLYNAGVGASLAILSSIGLIFAAVYYFSSMIHRTDIRRMAAERKIAQSEEKFRDLFNYSQGVICTHDLNGVITSINPATSKSIGFGPHELVGRSLKSLIRKDFRQDFDVYLRKIVNEGEDEGLLSVISKSGKPIVWRFHNVMIYENGEPSYVLGHGQDVTELMRIQAELEKLSLRDELTGLYNRRGFLTLAEQQLRLECHSGTARGLTIIFADMDGLKAINDTYGHDAGSEAIVELSKILRSVFRGADVISRWGGDEFVIMVIGAKKEDGQLLANRIDDQIESFNASGAKPYELGCSIGIKSIDVTSGRSLEDHINDADEAMYVEKRRRKRSRGFDSLPASQPSGFGIPNRSADISTASSL